MTFAVGVYRTPVYLSDDDRSCINHWHLIVEVGYLGLWVRIVIAAAIPSAVVVNCIAYVVTLDGVGGIACIVCLPSCAWNPDNASESVGANRVNDGLEVVVQSLWIILIVGILQTYRLICQLEAYLTCIFLDVGILGNDIPYRHQVLLVVVANLQVWRTYSRRAHYDIHAMIHSLLHQRPIESREVGPQT